MHPWGVMRSRENSHRPGAIPFCRNLCPGSVRHAGPHTSACPLASLASAASLCSLLSWRRKALGSAHLRRAARLARACGLAVRVRLGNCIPRLHRSALRARSAGGIAVSLPSSGCDGALTRPGNKKDRLSCTPYLPYLARRGRGGAPHIATARRRKRVSCKQNLRCEPLSALRLFRLTR